MMPFFRVRLSVHDSALPPAFQGIDKLERKLETMPAEIEAIKQYIDVHALR